MENPMALDDSNLAEIETKLSEIDSVRAHIRRLRGRLRLMMEIKKTALNLARRAELSASTSE
jgi:hypothetical protein